MFKIQLRNIFRNLLKNPGLLLIKTSGLIIGITCSVLVYIYVAHEFSYDTFNEKADRICRIAVKGLIGDTEIEQTYTCAPLPLALYDDFPEIEKVVRLQKASFKITHNEQVYFEKNALTADSTFFSVFTFPMIKGNPQKALAEPNTIVLTESFAKKYFGTSDPMDQTLVVDDNQVFRVTGVIKDVPDNSHFQFDFIASLVSFGYAKSNSWWNNGFQTYILLHPGTDPKQMDAKFPEFVAKHLFEGNGFNDFVTQGNIWQYYLQPLTSIHLNSDLSGELQPNGNLNYVRIFIIVGIFILLIACVNYMNLTTARASNRANEIGIKKVLGSDKKLLIFQFLGESLLTTFLALIIAIALVKMLLPFYSSLLNRNFNFHVFNLVTIAGLLGLTIIVGIISGSYPAFFLSSMKPIMVLKGSTQGGLQKSSFRNILVVVQFVVSLALIAGTIVINKQLNYIQNERLGFNKDQVIVVKNRLLIPKENKVIREQLMQSSTILNASFSHTVPGEMHNNIGFSAEQVEGWFTLNVCVCDAAYKDVMKLEMAEGRFFDDETESDINTIIINEAAAKLVNYEDGPIGKTFSGQYKVVGVVKDYHYESMHQKIRPMVFINARNRDWMSPDYISVRVDGKDLAASISHIKKVWDDNSGGYPFEYSFLDADYDQLYKNEQQTSLLFIIFAILAIFIACLGLVGLSSFAIERRIKEIGVRKVNGARVYEILAMLNIDFVKWVIVAFIIATPIGWFTMNKWLENFAYKTTLSWWIFALSGFIALGIALLTVSFQSWKAATRNPVEALRYE